MVQWFMMLTVITGELGISVESIMIQGFKVMAGASALGEGREAQGQGGEGGGDGRSWQPLLGGWGPLQIASA